MKRSVKIALIVAGILVVLGLVLMLVSAVAMGGADFLLALMKKAVLLQCQNDWTSSSIG